MEQIILDLPRSMVEKLKKRAKARQQSVGEIVTDYLQERFFQEHQ